MSRPLARLALTMLLAIAAACGAARADDAADFYRGRTVTILIGHPPGGSYDLYARLASRHLGRFLPGAPTVIVQGKPGGGATLAVAYFYAEAPRDGSMLGLFPETIAHTQLFEPKIGKWRVEEMRYVGSFAHVNPVFVMRKGAPAKSVEDMRRVPLNVGCSGRTGAGYQGAAVLKAYAGMKFKIICGYPGSAEFVLALAKGELDLVASAWNQWSSEHPQELRDGTFIPMFQSGLTRHKDLPNVPLMQDLVDRPDLKEVMRLVSAGADIGRALILPPGVPTARLATLRQAFDRMVADAAFREDAAAKHIELDPTPGARVQEISDAIVQAPRKAVEMVSEAIK
jgi:tripartite-type tricarboxylate transporter receptor subunit TctC